MPVKKLKNIFAIYGAVLIFFSGSCFAAKIYPSAGSTSAAFLKIPVSPRAAAMGGAFSAIGSDISSSFYNPAGLAPLEDKTFSFMHNDYFSNLNQFYTVYGLKGEDISFLKRDVLRKGYWAFSLNYFFTAKDLERRSGLYENDPIYPISPVEGKFKAWDLALGIHYGFNLSDYSSLGLGFKFINQNIDSDNASSFAVDLGFMKSFEYKGRVFLGGLKIENLGPGIKFSDERYDLPLAFKAGISHRFIQNNTLIGFDIHKYIDNYHFFVLGMEQPLSEKFFLRAGYKYRWHGNELGAWSGFSAGLGLAIRNFSFDYSFNPYGDLGYSHKVAVTMKFLKPKKPDVSSDKYRLKFSEKISNVSRYEYKLSSKPSRISPYYAEFNMESSSLDSFVKGVKFKTRGRGLPDENFYVYYGELPAEIVQKNKFSQIYKAFYFSYSLMVLNSFDCVLSIEKNWLDAKNMKNEDLKIFYLKSDKFYPGELTFLKEENGLVYYQTKLEKSPHYVLGR